MSFSSYPFSSIPFSSLKPPAPSAVNEDSWHQAWSTPVRRVAAVAVVASGLFAAPFTPTAETVTVDKWFNPLSEPVRVKKLATAQQLAFSIDPFILTQPEAVLESKWHQPWSEPVRAKRRLPESAQHYFEFEPLPRVSFGWFGNLSDPVRVKPRLIEARQTAQQPFVPDLDLNRWYSPFSEPVRFKVLAAAHQQAFAAQPFPIVPFGWYAGLSEPVRYRVLPVADHPYYTIDPFILTQPEAVLEPKWHQGWPDLAYRKPGLGTPSQQALAWSTFTPSPFELIFPDKWYVQWTDPVRIRPDIGAARQPYYAIDPFILTQAEAVLESKWHQPWSEPVRVKARLGTGANPSQFDQPFPQVAIGWFAPLSEPVRVKPDIGASRQPYYTIDPFILTQPEAVLESKWHQPWPDFARPARGLGAGLQQTYAAPFFVEPITLDKWYAPWREPVRAKPRLGEPSQHAFEFSPLPLVSFSWYGWLSEPVRYRVLPTALHPSFTIDPFILTQREAVFESKWHQAWSEPRRSKPGLLVSLQPFSSAWSTFTPPTVTVVTGWLAPWTDPYRVPARLIEANQQFWTFDVFAELPRHGGTSRFYGPVPWRGYRLPDPLKPKRPVRAIKPYGGVVEPEKPAETPKPVPIPDIPAAVVSPPTPPPGFAKPPVGHAAKVEQQIADANDMTDVQDLMEILKLMGLT